MDPDSGFCAGCFRTIDEIADWAIFDDDEKRQVWRQLQRRRQDFAATLPPAVAEPSRPDRPALTPPPGQHDR